MPDPLLAAVNAVMAEVAAEEVMPRWRNLEASDVAEKAGPDDLVTIADRRCELALSDRLARLLPGSLVVGEEAAAADPAVLARLHGAGPVWVIDPIDGTSAFAAGSPDFALMVALVRDGRSELGWILAPALGEITFGGIDHGVWQGTRGNAPVQLRPAAPPSQLAAMVGILGKRNITPQRRAELEAKARHFKELEGVTCAGLDYARLARGDVQFALYSKSEPWDHLPGLGILAGLGFRAAKHDGTPYRPGDNTGGLVVAPDAASLDRIRSAMLD